MHEPDPLIRTKLRLPFIRPSLVSRPRLQTRIAEGFHYPLTLVVAPAGFGKTTLVATSITESHMPAAWLSLDADDNRAGRFLTYLVAAFQGVDHSFGREAARLAVGMQPAPPEAVLTSLINDLEGEAGELLLVLDDYQFIRSRAVHEVVTFFLEHCPQAVHVLIATRSDPPLPLARLRARGQMVELREADLRFSASEAAQFLNEVMGLGLDNSSVQVLEDRTEGWVAGLQLAALSLRDRKDVAGFIEGFSGTHRHILDYLLEEILADQPDEVLQFLMQTSILERLCAPLCEAVVSENREQRTENRPSADIHGYRFSALGSRLTSQDAQSILEFLDRSNLFLIPLDDERIWFRYHHLFADLLVTQLLRMHPQGVSGLHSRASIWYESNGWLDQAIKHAIAAGDLDRTSRLVESGAQKLIFQVSFETMQEWINRLPVELVKQKAWIGITQGWLWVATMQIGSLDSWMDEVEERFLAGGWDRYSASEQQDIRANIASLRAYAAFFKGDHQRCADLSNQALTLLSPSNLDLRARILVQLGETTLALQDLEQASTFLNQAVDAGIGLGDYQSVTTASMRTYHALRTLGRLSEAEGMLRRVFEALARAGRAASPIATKLEQCWGDLLRERGQMAEAGAQLAQALEHARQYNSPLDIVTARIYQSMWHVSRADWDGAQTALDEAESLIRSYTIPPVVNHSWSLQQARICLERGEIERAEEFIGDPAREVSSIFFVRVLLKKGELEKAQKLLSQLEQAAVAGRRHGTLIQILLLQATAYRALDELPKALETLLRSLNLAYPEAYLMTFLEAGVPIYDLLKRLRSRPLPQPLAAYVLRLLQAFEQRKGPMLSPSDAGPQGVAAGQERASPTGDLVEPLSERELEVLHLISTGRTNKEIAGQLVVSPGTVKAHTASIYRKLDVANRTEAVARARQLGLLP